MAKIIAIRKQPSGPHRAQMDLHLAILNANAALRQLAQSRELTVEETVLLHYSELYLGAAR
jgi:hypothetical protein